MKHRRRKKDGLFRQFHFVIKSLKEGVRERERGGQGGGYVGDRIGREERE